jgi:GTP-binding protein Era
MSLKGQDDGYLSGFIAIIGPPNVGKSTLLNRLLGTKVAIVSPKPQTTRNRIQGILHGKGYQMVFMDTPGIHKTKTLLHKSMVSSATAAMGEVDIIVVMMEMLGSQDYNISLILHDIKNVNKPTFLVINKIDLGRKGTLLPIMDEYRAKLSLEDIIPISALTGDGVEILLEALISKLKEGPPFFPAGMKTDQSEAFLVSETIREQIYLHTSKELPYSSAVTVEGMEEIKEKKLLSINAHIHVESDSQKAILIGRKGRMIKAIGQSARFELEGIFNIHIFLDLRVRVEKNWSRDPRALRRLGY